MSTPYDPVTPFFDTLAILELWVQNGAADWPGDLAGMVSDVYDVADLIPAQVNIGANGEQKLVGQGESGAPETRFILDWHLWIDNDLGGLHTDASMVLLIECGASPAACRDLFSVTCIGQGTAVDSGPIGSPVTLGRYGLNGSLRIPARCVQASLRFFGGQPVAANAGVYLRPV